MAESVRALLDTSGWAHVPVYRLAEKAIGCSLAESAELPAYRAWLEKAAKTPKSLHVVYINTSIVTKAESQTLVPTITCTSSNVVQTVLQAFAQVEGLTVWYGPDTYMGENLRTLFATVAQMDDAQIAALHPLHTRATVRALLPQLQVFPQGNCVVHHMFGASVAEQCLRDYASAYHTAHLEVPGEMFGVANAAAAQGKGVVGSTSQILNFIVAKTQAALAAGPAGAADAEKLVFVLGTEAGMVTPIVRHVQQLLAAHANPRQVSVEIVFPVSAEAVAPQQGEGAAGGLAIVPGAGGGEGCSAAGGCATCPYMKMNSLDALVDLAARVEASRGSSSSSSSSGRGETKLGLEGFLPLRRGATVGGRPAAELGTVPILHMRDLSRTGKLSAALVADVLAR
jgi:quinolinate synthase